MHSKTALNAATVRAFLFVLTGQLTRYDERLQAKQPNNYRLGLWFEAAQRVQKKLARYLDSAEPVALNALKKALCESFHCDDMPPVKAVLKQIDLYLASGKLPKYAAGGTDKNLRGQLIRLAHQKPELRPTLLPLLASSSKRAAFYPPQEEEGDALKALAALAKSANLPIKFTDLDQNRYPVPVPKGFESMFDVLHIELNWERSGVGNVQWDYRSPYGGMNGLAIGRVGKDSTNGKWMWKTAVGEKGYV